MNTKDTILLVDDDMLVQNLNSDLLKSNGYKIYTAENGEICLKMAWEVQPDLILMDMSMPVMNGYEATRTLRQQGYSGLIIAFTGNTEQSEIIKAMEAGCRSVIEKPILDFDSFLNTIQDFIKEVNRNNHPEKYKNC